MVFRLSGEGFIGASGLGPAGGKGFTGIFIFVPCLWDVRVWGL